MIRLHENLKTFLQGLSSDSSRITLLPFMPFKAPYLARKPILGFFSGIYLLKAKNSSESLPTIKMRTAGGPFSKGKSRRKLICNRE